MLRLRWNVETWFCLFHDNSSLKQLHVWKMAQLHTLVQSMEMKNISCHIMNKNAMQPSAISGTKCKWGLPSCDPKRCTPPWGLLRAEEMQEARGTRKQDWPQIVEMYMKGMTSAQRHPPHQRCWVPLTWSLVPDVQTACSFGAAFI